MIKKATSRKPKKLKITSTMEYTPFKSPRLSDVDTVIETLLFCIRNDDIETFREVLVEHLITLNKVELAKKAGIGRRTIYDLLDPTKEFNPELKTLTALFKALAA